MEMDIEEHILNQLQTEEVSTIPGLGTFSLKKHSAAYDSKSSVFLPPGNKIVFSESDSNQDASAFNTSYQEKIEDWKKKLNDKVPFSIRKIGYFALQNDDLVFIGEQLTDLNPDFYGLGEIKVKPAENSVVRQSAPRPNGKNGTAGLWIILFLIPILGIVYLAYFHPESIFGKKSDLQPHQNKEKVQQHKDSVKTDSIQAYPTTIVRDSSSYNTNQ